MSYVDNTYWRFMPSQDPTITLMAVLIKSDSPHIDPETGRPRFNRAVYVGLVKLDLALDDDMDSDAYKAHKDKAAQWVKRTGAKQSYQKALAYFPHLKEENYRR